jgi:TolA-binding protein
VNPDASAAGPGVPAAPGAPDALPATPDAGAAASASASAPAAAPAAPSVDPGSAVRTQAEAPDPFKESGSDNSTVAAPQISDEQQIKNAMDMAYQLYHAEDYEACVRATAAILERYPKKQLYWVRYLNGLCQEHQELYAAAQEQYEKVRQEAARSTYANAAVFRIGLCQLKNGQAQEAIYTLRDIIENNPRSEYRLQAYIHLGNLYRRTHDWKAAQRIYKDLIKLYPNTSWAWTSTLYLAETHSNQGRNDIAIRVYEGLIRNEQVPKTLRAQAQLRIGDLQIAEQQWLEALQTYRIALRDFSDVPGVAVTAEQKMTVATEGRKYGRLPYRAVRRGITVNEAPADSDYRMKQENEKVPYK